MKYSKSDSEYFRNKKGGGLETNGKLSVENFNRNKINNINKINKFNSTVNNSVFNNKLIEINNSRNQKTFELPEMTSSGKYKIKPIKIMVKKKSTVNSLLGKDNHYIFFGYNPETGIYEYVCYVNQDFSDSKPNSGLPITCKQRKDDGTIVDLTHEQFLNINIRELSILIYNLLLRRQLLDQTFFKYLLDFVLPKILEKYKSVNNKNLHDIVDKIKKFIDIPNNANNANNVKLPKRRELLTNKSE